MAIGTFLPGGNAAHSDLVGLDKLRREANRNPQEALDEVARQFEGMFIKMVLKSMREAKLAEGLFSNSAVEMHQDMYDSEMAQHLSSGNGLGFSKALREQLGAVAGFDKEASADLPVNAQQLSLRAPLPRYQGVTPTAAPTTTPASIQGAVAIQKNTFESAHDFVETLWPAAQTAAAKLGVKPEVLVAQAAHETGWGKFIPEYNSGQSSHNLFGIKTGGQWHGAKITKNTLEVIDGVPQQQRADFRAYPSFESSFTDYSNLISSKPRYQQAINNAASPQDYLQGLQDGGYATDPQYAERIMRLFNSNRFKSAVEQVQTEPENRASTSQSVSQRISKEQS